MICPECKNEPMTMLKFFISGSRRVITCKSCGANLKATKNLKIGTISMVATLTLALIIIINSGEILAYQISIPLGSIILAVLWLIVVFLLWSFGTLEKSDRDHK